MPARGGVPSEGDPVGDETDVWFGAPAKGDDRRGDAGVDLTAADGALVGLVRREVERERGGKGDEDVEAAARRHGLGGHVTGVGFSRDITDDGDAEVVEVVCHARVTVTGPPPFAVDWIAAMVAKLKRRSAGERAAEGSPRMRAASARRGWWW